MSSVKESPQPKQKLKTDLVVIGAGSGGLSLAAGAVQMGARVVLIERGKMGGDCLNYGCVPSKALIAAAHAAQAQRSSADFGIEAHEPNIDFAAVTRHVRDVIDSIAPHDSEERFTELGVKVIRASASFLDRHTVIAGDYEVHARRFVIATGSRPVIPPIPGIDGVTCLTNETVFELKTCPRHLAILGGGPIGLELAQAFRRLGAQVSVIEVDRALAVADPALAKIVLDRLKEEGVVLHEKTRLASVASGQSGEIMLTLENGQGRQILQASHLLVAAGRKANVEDLNLAAAGVETTRNGIVVDKRLHTGIKSIYALGDVVGPLRFTHAASYQAGIAVRNILFRLPSKGDYHAIPWAIYTDPELAHVGLNEEEAVTWYGPRDKLRILTAPLAENDRARAERRTEGLAKIVVTKQGRILGATIVGAGAGDLIAPWALALSADLKISALAGFVVPYPTLSEVSKRAAGSFYTPLLFSPRTRAITRLLLKLP
jgi:pyruvate/2-oxoglutarate dehydrogenase complex dihydrolipoamide dehydrogenase (E3) component